MSNQEDHLSAKAPTAPATVPSGGMSVGGSVNVSGKGNAVGVGNTVHYTETTASQGANLADLAQLLQNLRGSLAQAGLDPKTHRAVEADLAAAGAEAEDKEPSGAIVLSKLESALKILTSAGDAGATLLPQIHQAIEWGKGLLG